jgi:hypothetical protein
MSVVVVQIRRKKNGYFNHPPFPAQQKGASVTDYR